VPKPRAVWGRFRRPTVRSSAIKSREAPVSGDFLLRPTPLIAYKSIIMHERKPITRNWPSPDEMAAVDHGIRKLVASLEPAQAEHIRLPGKHVRIRIQRVMEVIFRAGSQRQDHPARPSRQLSNP